MEQINLSINSKSSFLIEFDKDYDNIYFDSYLYYINDTNKQLLINDSFAFTIGMELFKRINNINICHTESLEEFLIKVKTLDDYCIVERLNDFELVECESYATYLYKYKNKVIFEIYKVKIPRHKYIFNKLKYTKLEHIELDEDIFSNWNKILIDKFIPLYDKELRRMNDYVEQTTDEIIDRLIKIN